MTYLRIILDAISHTSEKLIERGDKYENRMFRRLEPRARKNDFSEALSFEVHDPLWMLTRQWQFGRFQGDDCGSAVTTKIKIKKQKLDAIYCNGNMKAFSNDRPLEYDVEKQNRAITPFIRIESALYFKKMIELELLNTDKVSNSRLFKRIIAAERKPTIAFIRALQSMLSSSFSKTKEALFAAMKTSKYCPLDDFETSDENPLEKLKDAQNKELKRYFATYGKRVFDGYKLFLKPSKILRIFQELFQEKALALSDVIFAEFFIPIVQELIEEYQNWFRKKYLPVENEIDNCWNEEKMGYDVMTEGNGEKYEAEDYHTGKLSWYSFDFAGVRPLPKEHPKRFETKYFTYLPTPAMLPGAPNKRLWQFEDSSVYLGHQTNNDFSLLANAVVMQYATMYGNDWMITPLESEVGALLDVEGIIVTDTFGERTFINTPAADNNKGSTFTERWDLFGTSRKEAYETNNFKSLKGLFFPPTLPRCEESKPIEEVQFLRDEMANMLWGVETVINNRCDGVLNGKDLSDAALSEIDSQKIEYDAPTQPYDYSYLLQNRVPLNWIPFIPQKIVGEAREIKLRRGRMPIFYQNEYQSVRPSTELLKIKKEGDKVKARFINEEEVTGYGVKLVLTAQRTRWFLGKSYNWLGAKKVVSQYQANSGLMFDALIEEKKEQME